MDSERLHSLPDSSRVYHAFGDSIRIRIPSTQTGGTLSVIETHTPPGSGPPLHVHHREHEAFHVVEGEFEFQVGDEVIRAEPGAMLFAPKEVPHRFQNVGATPGRMVVTLVPGGFEQFFVEAHDLFAAGSPSEEDAIALGKRYDLEFL